MRNAKLHQMNYPGWESNSKHEQQNMQNRLQLNFETKLVQYNH